MIVANGTGGQLSQTRSKGTPIGHRNRPASSKFSGRARWWVWRSSSALAPSGAASPTPNSASGTPPRSFARFRLPMAIRNGFLSSRPAAFSSRRRRFRKCVMACPGRTEAHHCRRPSSPISPSPYPITAPAHGPKERWRCPSVITGPSTRGEIITNPCSNGSNSRSRVADHDPM